MRQQSWHGPAGCARRRQRRPDDRLGLVQPRHVGPRLAHERGHIQRRSVSTRPGAVPFRFLEDRAAVLRLTSPEQERAQRNRPVRGVFPVVASREARHRLTQLSSARRVASGFEQTDGVVHPAAQRRQLARRRPGARGDGLGRWRGLGHVVNAVDGGLLRDTRQPADRTPDPAVGRPSPEQLRKSSRPSLSLHRRATDTRQEAWQNRLRPQCGHERVGRQSVQPDS